MLDKITAETLDENRREILWNIPEELPRKYRKELLEESQMKTVGSLE